MEDFKTHIPKFGNWNYETEPFESVRKAGVLRYTSYGEEQEDLYSYYYYSGFREKNLYLNPTEPVVHGKKIRTEGREEKERRRQVKVHDVGPKAVDEDLYKIPPELLYGTYPKKKKGFGLFARCLVPCCSA